MIFMKKLTTRLLSLVLLGAFIPSFVLAQEWDLNNGNIIVNAVPGTEQTVSQAGSTPTVDNNPVITSNGNSTNNTVTITAGENATANVTLENVNINTGGAAISTSGKGDVNIELNGTNTVQSGTNHAGVEKTNGGTLTITDTNQDNGSLTATGGDRGAGIGGGNDGSGSHITISGGKVTAKGGRWAAGIGGGEDGNGSHITIEGGTVEATGGDGAAGIGGGFAGAGSDITVSGGKVTATGGKDGGAGIGSGYNAGGDSATDIKIEGGDVTAQGGENGAGIGGGYNSSANNIEVSKGTVQATGGNNGAGIGGGGNGNGSNIKIEGGQVSAQGGGCGAGIGGGGSGSGQGNGSNIKIDGGQVTAQGGHSGAGIGGGYGGTGRDVEISGDAQVKAQGGADWASYKKGAAIGNGGTPSQEGDELTFDPSKLTVDGFIQTYKPGGNIDTDKPETTTIGTSGEHSWDKGTVTTQPTCTTEGVMTYTCKNPAHGKKTVPIPALNHDFKTYIYDNNATCEADGTETAKCERCDATDTRTAKGSKLTGNTAETAAEARQDAYWVCGADGHALPYQSQVKDGVLTVTVQADTASLRGTTGSLRQLEAQGITGIRFVTNRAQSDFTLSDLLTSGTGSFTLTHDGETVTFTLAEKDISGILK